MADAVKMRIGFEGARELELEIEDSEAVRAAIEKAIDKGSPVVWVTDVKGNRFGLIVAKLAFVQVDAGGDRAGVGFGQ